MAHDMSHSAQYWKSQRAILLGSQKGSPPAKPDGLTYPLETRPTQTRFVRRPGRLHKVAISDRLRSDKRHIVSHQLPNMKAES